MNFPDQIRNITLAGHLHHGKTAFMDMLVFETHDLPPQAFPKKGAQVGFYRMFQFYCSADFVGLSSAIRICISLNENAVCLLNRHPCP